MSSRLAIGNLLNPEGEQQPPRSPPHSYYPVGAASFNQPVLYDAGQHDAPGPHAFPLHSADWSRYSAHYSQHPQPFHHLAPSAPSSSKHVDHRAHAHHDQLQPLSILVAAAATTEHQHPQHQHQHHHSQHRLPQIDMPRSPPSARTRPASPFLETIQHSERASVRLAARSSIQRPSSHPYDDEDELEDDLEPPPIDAPQRPNNKRRQPHDGVVAQPPPNKRRAPAAAAAALDAPADSPSNALLSSPKSRQGSARPANAKPAKSAESTPRQNGARPKGRVKKSRQADDAAPASSSRTQSKQSAVTEYKFTRDVTNERGEVTGQLFGELQHSRCMSNRYKSDDFPRCLSCTRRWAGDTCRFQNVRLLLRDAAGVLREIDFLEKPVTNLPSMMYPDSWNKPLAPEHIQRVKLVAARDLISTLREEREHLMLPKLVRRVRETDCRATCDTCLTSVFAGSWICTSCGREACSDCHSKIVEICGDPEKKQRTLDASPFFLTCTRKQEHTVDNYRPISRFSIEEVDGAIRDMERVLADEAKLESPPSTLPELSPPSDRTSSSSSLHPSPGPPLLMLAANGASISRTLANGSSIDPSVEDNSAQRWCTMLPQVADASLPYHSVRLFHHSEMDPAVFRSLWAVGEPLVIEGLLDLCKIKWTPEYFIQEYGSESCLVVECQTDVNKRITVEEFFAKFGEYDERRECWKLKDWPSSTDFKSVFPQLFEDFMNVVPMPDYSRRDGVLNISSHFPVNTVGPDLGPKMYNAYASNLDRGSKGSTRLHMDMADAVNIMHHAMPRPDGTEGGAVWDIFSAEDSSKLRKFIRSRFKEKCQNGVDPIHSQLFYLDNQLLDDLYNEHGVISYRLYQRPGEAVFIPAGCAHQVCNLSDCIKVAVDFVSPENVERCEKLTQEFREQNQVAPWKEDILQLKTMLWFAWLSCSIAERRMQTA